jgi:hypothetical protein
MRLRASIHIPCQSNKPFGQPGIAKVRPAQFFLGPVMWGLDAFLVVLRHGLVLGIRCAKQLTGIFCQGAHVHVLDRPKVIARAIHSAPALGNSDAPPVCGTITGSFIPAAEHVRFHQDRSNAVTLIPVFAKPLCAKTKHMGGKIGYPWDKEKSTVAKDLRQMLPSRLVGPANPLIASCNAPRRRAEGQSAYRPIGGAVDKIPYLRTAKRATTQVVEGFHKRVPESRRVLVTQLDRYNLYVAEAFKTATQIFDSSIDRLRIGRPSHGAKLMSCPIRKFNNSPRMKADQRLAAAHFLEFPVRGSPIQPLTNATGQTTTRNARLLFQQGLYPAYHLGAEFLTAGNHATLVPPTVVGVQKKDVGNAQRFRGGDGAP